jgi:4-alpha-glucanotransferase
MKPIADLAVRWGIEADYVDAAGRLRRLDEEALERLTTAVSGGRAQPDSSEPAAADPGAAYLPESFRRGERQWLLAVQLYGVRSRRNWGHGDFTDAADLLRMVAAAGAAGLGLNPLHAAFWDRPDWASPYAPSSRLFLNPLYIDLDTVPEFPGLAAIKEKETIDGLRPASLMDYRAVAAVKAKGLRAAYESFRSRTKEDRHDDFASFRAERGEALRSFAAFETLRARFGSPWTKWPVKWVAPDLSALDELEQTARAEMEFYAYVQWLADRQLGRCRDLARRLDLPLGLYFDIAVSVAPDGADAWAQQSALINDVSLGAPPDLYNSAGQDWGLAAFNPHAWAAHGFAAFRQVLAAAMRHAGAVRVDHVLGLNRLFLVPRGLPASRGGYLRCPLEAMLAVVAEESRRSRCVVVGEDLGTVPEGLSERLARRGLLSSRLLLFERGEDGAFRPPDRYPAQALVSFSTHDLPTYAGWLGGRDLRAKRAVGLEPGETEEDRAGAVAQLRAALAQCGLDFGEEGGAPSFPSVARFLAKTPSYLLAISLEDALGLADQPNLPGTIDEYPNWRRRLPIDLEDIAGHPGFRDVAAALREERGARSTTTPGR